MNINIQEEIKKDVETQKRNIIEKLQNTKELEITTDTFLKAVCFRKYANSVNVDCEDIDIDIDEKIKVDLYDFIEHELQFSNEAEELEEKYKKLNYLEYLRDIQSDAQRELLEELAY